MAHVPCCEPSHPQTHVDPSRLPSSYSTYYSDPLSSLTGVNKGPLSIAWHGGQCGTFDSSGYDSEQSTFPSGGSTGTSVYRQRIVAMNRLDSRLIQTKQHKELMSTVLIQSPPPPSSFVQCGAGYRQPNTSYTTVSIKVQATSTTFITNPKFQLSDNACTHYCYHFLPRP
jgi:hypothetical protein